MAQMEKSTTLYSASYTLNTLLNGLVSQTGPTYIIYACSFVYGLLYIKAQSKLEIQLCLFHVENKQHSCSLNSFIYIYTRAVDHPRFV